MSWNEYCWSFANQFLFMRTVVTPLSREWSPFRNHTSSLLVLIFTLIFKLKHSNHYNDQKPESETFPIHGSFVKWVYLFPTRCLCILFMKFLRKKKITSGYWEAWKRWIQLRFPDEIWVFSLDGAGRQNPSQRTMPIWGHKCHGVFKKYHGCAWDSDLLHCIKNQCRTSLTFWVS